MNDIHGVIFYSIEKAIKTYRQFAQRRLAAAGYGLTVDQWLMLNVMDEEPGIQQGAVAEAVFKDKASVARTMDLLVQAGLVARTVPANDRRSVRLALTAKGRKQREALEPVVSNYRKRALTGISQREIDQLNATLLKIMANCNE